MATAEELRDGGADLAPVENGYDWDAAALPAHVSASASAGFVRSREPDGSWLYRWKEQGQSNQTPDDGAQSPPQPGDLAQQ